MSPLPGWWCHATKCLSLVFSHPCLFAMCWPCAQVNDVCLWQRSGCVWLHVLCCCGAEGLVTLSRFLIFHDCGLSVGRMHHQLLSLVCWFSFFRNSPSGRAVGAQPRRPFGGSHNFKNSSAGKDLAGGGRRTLDCFRPFLLIIRGFNLIDDLQKWSFIAFSVDLEEPFSNFF